MWDRKILKSNAKAALKGHWGLAIAVVLVAALLGGNGAFGIIQFNSGYSNASESLSDSIYGYDMFNYDAVNTIIAGVLGFMSFLALLVAIFVGFAVTVGCARYFVRNHFGQRRFGTLFSSFGPGYGTTTGGMLVTNIFVGLWSLLFLFPGIYKSYQYCMVPYLLSDNPLMTGTRARELSRHLTDGEKGAIFVLDLSFLLWYLPLYAITFVMSICLMIGIFSASNSLLIIVGMLVLLLIPVAILTMLFVTPYVHATKAELYIYLRDRAIQYNQINPAELWLAPSQPVSGPQPGSGPQPAAQTWQPVPPTPNSYGPQPGSGSQPVSGPLTWQPAAPTMPPAPPVYQPYSQPVEPDITVEQASTAEPEITIEPEEPKDE